jgi:hypothetical protein
MERRGGGVDVLAGIAPERGEVAAEPSGVTRRFVKSGAVVDVMVDGAAGVTGAKLPLTRYGRGERLGERDCC